MRRVVIGIFTLAVLAVLFMALCTFVRRPYEVVLLNRFGALIECSDATMQQHSPIMYNWYFKFPTDQIVPIDTRLHLEQTPLQQVVTKGAEPISIRTFVAWRIADPIKFYKTTGGSDEKARAIIGRKIAGLVQAKVAGHMLDELFNTDPTKVRMDQMESAIAKEATEGSQDPNVKEADRMSGVNEQGLEIAQIGFSRMAFPPANANAVYERMSMERKKQADAFRAEGEALASQIRAEGEAKAAEIRGSAVEKAERIRGEADMKANQILADVQQSKEAKEFYKYWKQLDFAKTSLTRNAYIVLSTDTDWLHGLFNNPQSVKPFATTMPAGASEPKPELPSLRATEPINPMSK